jgi:hypothetical protein
VSVTILHIHIHARACVNDMNTRNEPPFISPDVEAVCFVVGFVEFAYEVDFRREASSYFSCRAPPLSSSLVYIYCPTKKKRMHS